MQKIAQNPKHRLSNLEFETFDDGWSTEASLDRLTFHEETCKTALSANQSPDIDFEFGVNPYRGCQHGCIYCYARPTHQYLDFGAGTEFDTQIVVKTNVADRLGIDLARAKTNPEKWLKLKKGVALSGNTDAYQPAERKYGLSRDCLRQLISYEIPPLVITKSLLVRRDIDLLSYAYHSGIGAGVHISVPTLDPDVARAIEPHAPPPHLRLKLIRELSQHLPVGVAVAPVIHGLTEDETPAILKAARVHGATDAFYIMLRLPNEVSDYFVERLEEKFPLRARKVQNKLRAIFGGELYKSGFHKRMQGSGRYAELTRKQFQLFYRKYGYGLKKMAADPSRVKRPELLPQADNRNVSQYKLFS